MNRILLSAALALTLTGGLALAQQAETPTPQGTHHRHSHDPQQQAAWLSKQLNLTPDQTAKLEPILADRNQKMAALRSNTSISHADWMQQMRTIHQDTKQHISTILTPDQLQTMKSLRHRHGGSRGGQDQPSSQPQSQPAPPNGL